MPDNKNEEIKSMFPMTSVKRLLKDVKDVYKEPLERDGIYYKHDEKDFNFGYALILGPRDSIYENGYYFFKFEFPHDYPHSPPKVIFHTNDGIVRFHPNFYRNGKVCLSLLNTWRGEGWTSCQTIKTILLTLCSLLTNDSLLNEPGITKYNKDFKTYHDIIRFKNMSVAIAAMMRSGSGIYPSPIFDAFKPIVEKHFIENYESNIARVNKLAKCRTKAISSTSIYSMKVSIDYEKVGAQIKEIYDNIMKKNRLEKTQESNDDKQNDKN